MLYNIHWQSVNQCLGDSAISRVKKLPLAMLRWVLAYFFALVVPSSCSMLLEVAYFSSFPFQDLDTAES